MPHATIALLLALTAGGAPPDDDPKMRILLWFDTEDLLLESSDDAALRNAEFCTREGVKANFKIVGEKIRVLEKRGRTDVIEALAKHEIGYHSEWHSVHPTPAQYCSALGWDEGVAEFMRREGRGVRDLRRIFGRNPTWYGQPGASWCPQAFGAMRKWNIPVYLDIGSHVGLDRKPHWYGGALVFYDLPSLRVGLGGEKDLEAAKARFTKTREAFLAGGGGVAHIFYHPCEFVHVQFWDGVNFRNGETPLRKDWKKPPEKTPEQKKAAFDTFEAYIRWIRATYPDVEFITATDATRIYRDRAKGRTFPEKEIREIAAGVTDAITFQRRDDLSLSAGEILWLLNSALVGAPATLAESPIGPTEAPPEFGESFAVGRGEFLRTAHDVAAHLREHGRVPSAVWLGSRGIPPEAWLAAVARAVSADAVPDRVEIRPATPEAARYVRKDSPRIWGWLFPKGFSAPRMMELAARQAWTLKPAIAVGSR